MTLWHRKSSDSGRAGPSPAFCGRRGLNVASSVEQQGGDGGDRRQEGGGARQRGGGAAAEGSGVPAFPLRPVVGHHDNVVIIKAGRLEEVEELLRGVGIFFLARDDQVVATCVRVEIVIPPGNRTLRSAGGGQRERRAGERAWAGVGGRGTGRFRAVAAYGVACGV